MSNKLVERVARTALVVRFASQKHVAPIKACLLHTSKVVALGCLAACSAAQTQQNNVFDPQPATNEALGFSAKATCQTLVSLEIHNMNTYRYLKSLEIKLNNEEQSLTNDEKDKIKKEISDLEYRFSPQQVGLTSEISSSLSEAELNKYISINPSLKSKFTNVYNHPPSDDCQHEPTLSLVNQLFKDTTKNGLSSGRVLGLLLMESMRSISQYSARNTGKHHRSQFGHNGLLGIYAVVLNGLNQGCSSKLWATYLGTSLRGALIRSMKEMMRHPQLLEKRQVDVFGSNATVEAGIISKEDVPLFFKGYYNDGANDLLQLDFPMCTSEELCSFVDKPSRDRRLLEQVLRHWEVNRRHKDCSMFADLPLDEKNINSLIQQLRELFSPEKLTKSLVGQIGNLNKPENTRFISESSKENIVQDLSEIIIALENRLKQIHLNKFIKFVANKNTKVNWSLLKKLISDSLRLNYEGNDHKQSLFKEYLKYEQWDQPVNAQILLIDLIEPPSRSLIAREYKNYDGGAELVASLRKDLINTLKLPEGCKVTENLVGWRKYH